MTEPRRAPVKLRPEILASAPYRQGKPAPEDAFKLSSNENPFPPIRAVADALADIGVNRYPDATARALSERLAERHGVDVGSVHVGAGSVSILAQLIQAAAGPGDEVVYAWRSFEAYPGLVTVAGATSVQVPNRADHSHDLGAMAAAVTDRTRAIIVCTPNNPTGTIVTAADFETFMAAVPTDVLVILDEAYAEFVTDPDAVRGDDVRQRYPNVVVLRTFSKAYGLAGVRVGYALGDEAILNGARAAAIPLSVTEVAQRAALAALDHEAELLAQVDEIVRRRDDVARQLVDAGAAVPVPHGNFVWLATAAHTAEANEVLLRHRIVGRMLGDDGIRVSIGEAGSVALLVAAVSELVANHQVPLAGRG